MYETDSSEEEEVALGSGDGTYRACRNGRGLRGWNCPGLALLSYTIESEGRTPGGKRVERTLIVGAMNLKFVECEEEKVFTRRRPAWILLMSLSSD